MSTQEFTAQPRRVPGQGVLERLEQRKQRRPRIGMSPEFYARFGMADPWAEGPLELQDDPGSLFTYVDATRYRRMMRRLAFSRWRRERRAKLFQSRRVGLPTAARRAFPGESRRFTFGLRTLGLSEMVVPEAPEPEVIEVPVQSRPRWVRNGMRSVDNPWTQTRGGPARSVQTRERQDDGTRSVTTDRPARVARARSMDRVGARLEQSQASRDPVRKALEAAGPRLDRRTQRKVQATLAATAHLPPAERAVRIREVLRTVRVVREVFEERVARTVPSNMARPAEIARGRVAAEPSRRRGLRPVMGRSPSMDVLAPIAEPQVEAAPAPRKSNTQTALARSTTRRVSAWSKPPTSDGARVSRSISRSPVARSGAPLKRTASGAYVPARRMRTVETSTVLSRAVKTAESATQGAKSGSTRTTPTSASQTHRTASSGTTVSGTHKTQGQEAVGARSTRTSTAETLGARSTSGASHAGEATRSATTANRQDTGARSVQTAAGDTQQSQALRTQGRESRGARSFTTAAAQARGVESTAELETTGLGHVGARSFRTAASAHAAARAGVQPPSRGALPTPARVAARSASGSFIPARRVAGARSEQASPSDSHGAWALQRLERTGTASTARRGRSLLPRMAPRAPESTYVVHANADLDVQAMVSEIKRSVPGAQVSVREPKAVKAWGPSPVAAAAERAQKSPVLSQSAGMALPSSTERTLRRAVESSARVVRTRNPVRYARKASAEQVTLAGVDPSTLTSLPAQVRKALGGTDPTQAVRTAQGVWIPASSFTTESAGSWSGARALRTAASRSAGARSGTTQSGSAVGAARRRTVGSQGTGAARFRTPPLSGGGAQVFLSPEREDVEAQGFQTTAREDRAARVGVGRPVAWAGARTQLTETGAWQGAERFTTGRGGFAPGERVQGANRQARGARRNTLSTLEALSAQEYQAGGPSWAERTTRPSRIRTPGDLVDQLVQAQDVEQLVGIIVERGAEIRPNMGLPKPVIQVIEQIRSVAAAEEQAARSAGSGGRQARVGARASTRRRNAKVIRGFASLKGGTASSTAGVGPDKVMKLASKLRNLIHLAEGGRTADAQRQVKLAHGDRPDGRMENGTDSGNSETAAKQSVDIEALAREVLDVVNREKELRQERRQEESDADVWW